MTRGESNINDSIVENYVAPESVFDKKRTKTSHFMLNSVFPNGSLATTEYFVNAFIDDMEFKHRIVRPIFVLFKVKPKDTRWTTIVPRLRAKNEYILEYFAGMQEEKNLIMMVFQVPEKYAKDYLNFRNGKYSEFSDGYKKLFARYTHNDRAQPIESKIWQVIHKSDTLKAELETYFNIPSTIKIGKPVKFGKDEELWGIPEPKYEVFRYQQ